MRKTGRSLMENGLRMPYSLALSMIAEQTA
jgi:hypothetical protein